MKTWISVWLFLIGCFAASGAQQPFELKDGDRVVFLGDTLMEREQYHGYIELALASHASGRNVTFRNLGWSGDTPEGISRMGLSKLQAGHEPAGEGWRQLVEQIELTKPTVVFLGYGMASSFDGRNGVPKFKQDVNQLLDMIIDKTKGNVRFVILSPIRHENLPPMPNPAPHNAQLELYTDALHEIASQRKCRFISLFDDLKIETSKKPSRPLTDNGIHLNADGYRAAARVIVKGLGWKSSSSLSRSRAEFVRQEILKKNEVFFNRSRPQNMAYIFGFRKHEQGKNAVEIPMFDPLLDAMDEKISKLIAGEKLVVEKPVPLPKYDKPFTPQPLPDFKLADGLEVNLYAENPQLAKPIQMNFDAQGRLWVASSAIYPQIEPGQKAEDKIIVLEDTDGNGHADKSTVFAEGLFIPTAVVPGDGGVYVGQSTELLHFADKNGDGKADERRIVLSGFGTEDTHHTIHTLRWGPDGQLYFNQSIYIRTDTETPHEVIRLHGGGVFNLRPSTMAMDVFLRGFCNTWGHIFDEYGQSFTTDGCGSQGISYGIRDAMYLTYPKMRRELKSISPGSYPKFCGLEVVRSQHFPADWQNTLVSCDFRANRMVRFKITDDGSGFADQELPEFMRTTNSTFRPIDVKLGPDGALYIADWSNPIINHGEVDFRDPRRDRWHGRIWRVTAKNQPLVAKPKLATAKTDTLFDELLSPNDFNRNQARRVLTERGDKIKRDLENWTTKQSDEKALLEALWVHQSVDVPNEPLLNRLLSAQDPRIRAAAVRVLSFWLDRVPNAPDLLAAKSKDLHARVRLEAVRALAKIPSARSAELVLGALQFPMDPFLDYGIWLSINDLARPWLDAVQSGAWNPDGRERQLEFALKAIEPSLANTVLEKLLAKRTIPRDGGAWIELIGQSGGPNELRKLYDQVLADGFDDKAATRALTSLDEAARLRNLKPTGDLNSLQKLFGAKNETTRIAAIKLAGRWKLEHAAPQLLHAVEDAFTSAEFRKAALDSLREIGGKPVQDGLKSILATSNIPATRQHLVTTLAAINLDDAIPHMVTVAFETQNEAEAQTLWRGFLSVKGAGAKLAAALPKEIPVTVAKPALKVAREGGRNESDLVLALTRSADLDDADKELTTEELKQLAQSISNGDAKRGEAIYRRTDLACMSCHAIGGAGGKVGPDMTSIGASAPSDYLIESLLYPNKKIKEGYHSLQITTKEDQEYSGIIVRENDQELVLRDAANNIVSIAKNQIQSRKNGASLMPAGLIDALSATERADLVRFLTELGKPGPFDASKGNVARSWKVFVADGAPTDGDKLLSGDPTTPGWMPFYSTVEGKLLKNELEAHIKAMAPKNPTALFATTTLQLASTASVKLGITGATQELWVNGKRFDASSAASLPQGKHTVVVKLTPSSLPEQIRLDTNEGTFITE